MIRRLIERFSATITDELEKKWTYLRAATIKGKGENREWEIISKQTEERETERLCTVPRLALARESRNTPHIWGMDNY